MAPMAIWCAVIFGALIIILWPLALLMDWCSRLPLSLPKWMKCADEGMQWWFDEIAEWFPTGTTATPSTTESTNQEKEK